MQPGVTLRRYFKKLNLEETFAARFAEIRQRLLGSKGFSQILKSGLVIPVLVFLASFVLLVLYSFPLEENAANNTSGVSLPEVPAAVSENQSDDPVGVDNDNHSLSNELSPARSPAFETPKPVGQVNDVNPPVLEQIIDDQASMPVGFVDPPFPDELTEEQVNELSFLREEFVTLVGGVNQDPADPTYLDRWSAAQRQVDEEFMGFFGEEAFNRQQLKAVTSSQ